MRPAVKLTGLDHLRKRLAALRKPAGLEAALRAEAEAVAARARAALHDDGADGRLAASVQIRDESQGDSFRYRVGTTRPEGWHREFGTARRGAAPWLGPALAAGLPAVNQALRKVLQGALKDLGRS